MSTSPNARPKRARSTNGCWAPKSVKPGSKYVFYKPNAALPGEYDLGRGYSAVRYNKGWMVSDGTTWNAQARTLAEAQAIADARPPSPMLRFRAVMEVLVASLDAEDAARGEA
jgi:hypothetical protein